ncbi:MAG: glycosyltransferase family 87 protein [Beijerinckiaceae bacterium]|nr:glycosyltransferase family 87 protein [Beijerinckiaceae bacterium]
MFDAARSGAWLTRDRLRVYPLLLGLGLGGALITLIATRSGLLDHWGRPLGTDFSQFWVAGFEVAAGHPAQPYDNTAHAAAQAALFGQTDGFYSWPYPPYFLGLAALFATLPYLAALALWQTSTLALYLAAIWHAAPIRRLGRTAVVSIALVYPAVTVNLVHGQNGFLTAALLGAGALLVPKRPVIAGVLLGLLAYKPQFALAVPVALLAGGYFRTVFAAALTVAAATLAALAAFGSEPWHAFFASLEFTRHAVLEQGGPGFGKTQSAFAAVRLLGGSVSLAYAIQGAVTVSVLVALAWLWRGERDHRLKAAGLIVASLLSTPYCLDYDLTVLGPAIALLVSYGIVRGFPPYGKTLLAVIWALPLFARPLAAGLGVPTGAALMLILFGGLIWVARNESCACLLPKNHAN